MKKDHKAQGNLDTEKTHIDYRSSPSAAQLNIKHQQVINQHLPLGIVETSLEGQYLDANEEFCHMLGYEKDELPQRGIKDVTHEDDYHIDIKLHGQLVAGEIPYYRLEKRFERKDGQILWAQMTRSAVRDAGGTVRYIVGIVLDITERRLAGDALRESERKFSLVFDQLHFAARLTRPQDGLLLDVNETFEAIFGYSKQEVIGNTLLELGLNPDAEARELILAELLERGSVRGIELELSTKSKPAFPRLENSIEVTLLRISQEALPNTARHAQATQAVLSLRLDEKQVYLTIEDNGVGIPSLAEAKHSRSHGLKIMQERAEAFGGTLNIQSASDQGARIEVAIPLSPREPDTVSQEQSL